MIKLFSTMILLGFTFNNVYLATIKDSNKCKKYPCLIFEDNFNDFDLSVWEHLRTAAATGNNEFQYYTNNRSNSFVKDGVLYLKPTLTKDTFGEEFLYNGTLNLWGSTPWTTCTSNLDSGCKRKGSSDSLINPIQSASIRSANKFSFKYGKVDVKAKLPQGDWIWPAIWLMPKYSVYGDWPASGEIDLMESRGNENLTVSKKDLTQIGNKRVSQSLHWGPYYPQNGHPKTLASRGKTEGSFASSYHVYTVIWTKHDISFYIDNSLSLNVSVGNEGFWKFGEFNKLENASNPWENGSKMAPFDQEFYIILNTAVGGTNRYFDENFEPRIPWDNNSNGQKAMKEFWENKNQWLPTWKGNNVALKIDYVRVWKLEPNSSGDT
ncbi:beta-1,3-glucan-binding protein [Hydra vulgaris]|uniref:Beta-1,3-glucan-binding protein n=1 Tax=Hydra vulgaris TaxID=6087 RepID=A0ABM4CQH0_HYDVU